MPCKHMACIISKLHKNPFIYFDKIYKTENFKRMIQKMGELTILDLDKIVRKIQELDCNSPPYPPDQKNLSKKWKDRKVNFKKKGRKRSKRAGKGPGE